MKNIIASLIAGCTILFSSCVSMDLTPLAQGNSESWYSTEQELEMATAEYYILGYWIESLLNSEQWTDNFTYRQENRGASSTKILNGDIDGSTYEVYNVWQQAYKLVARANSLLEGIHRAEGNVPEHKINAYKAEAYFVRACRYTDLVFLFGDIPWLDKYITIDEALSMGRRSKDEIIPILYEDFDYAAQYLPVTSPAGPSRATKGAAYAMKARLALYMGDWDVAAEAAKACMDLGVYKLEPDFAKLFLQTTKLNDEKVFCIPRSISLGIKLDDWLVNNSLPRLAAGFAACTPSWDLLAAFLCTDGKPIDESPLFDPTKPFKNRDPRCAMTIVEFGGCKGADVYGTENCDYIYNPHPQAETTIKVSTGASVTNTDSHAQTIKNSANVYASFNCLLWKKGIEASWKVEGCEIDYSIMRYADVLLMYAEAKIELNQIDDSVIDAMNAVRARAYGVAAANTSMYPALTKKSQADMRREVRVERRVELANEGSRYFDLIRWKLAEKMDGQYNFIHFRENSARIDKLVNKDMWFWPGVPEIDENGCADFKPWAEAGLIEYGAQRKFPSRQYLWPIPTHDNSLAKKLGQNDGY